jgi:uncharacterized protein YbjQ (UPF0145 family)
MPLFGGSKGTPPQQPPAPGQQPGQQPSQPFSMAGPSRERLREMRGAGTKPALFTSDLSVNEFLLVKKAGFEPLGLVIGSSIYHIGYQQGQWNQNMELGMLSQAMYHARELAMSRMEAEADVLGADGVVGVRLEIGFYSWGESLAEFMAVGTAVRSSDGQSHRTPEGKPFTSDLSGQDFYVLRTMGYQPLSLVMGSCVYHVAHQTMRQAWRTMNQNIEMDNFTQALYDARELAMERMQREASRHGADGVVGVQVKQQSHSWESHVIEYFSVGTAVKSGLPVKDALPGVNAPTLSLLVNG